MEETNCTLDNRDFDFETDLWSRLGVAKGFSGGFIACVLGIATCIYC